MEQTILNKHCWGFSRSNPGNRRASLSERQLCNRFQNSLQFELTICVWNTAEPECESSGAVRIKWSGAFLQSERRLLPSGSDATALSKPALCLIRAPVTADGLHNICFLGQGLKSKISVWNEIVNTDGLKVWPCGEAQRWECDGMQTQGQEMKSCRNALETEKHGNYDKLCDTNFFNNR